MFIRSLLRACAFLKDRRGGVAPIFALSIIPVIGLTGMAVDYSRGNAIKAAVQAAIDATALAMAKSAPSMTPTDLQAKSDAYFRAVFNHPEATVDPIQATYSTQGGIQLVLSATGHLDTTFTRIPGMGFTKLDIGSSATIKWGNTRLRLALVLDTTGSMASAGKIDALKTATKNLLDQLSAASTTNGDVYVSIVPFSRDVNAGTSNYNATWIDWTAWEAPPASSTPSATTGPGSSCPYSSSNNGFRCTSGPSNDANCNGGSNNTCVSTIPSSGTYKGYICPSQDNGNKDITRSGIYYNGCYTSTTYSCTGSTCTCTGHNNCACSGSGSNLQCKTQNGYYEHAWVSNARSTWNGCITDRGSTTAPGTTAGNDQKITAPTASDTTTLFPAQQYYYCSPQMMGLSYDWSTMKSLVDGLYPDGSTNQPIGLVSGWQSLVGIGPFTMPPKDTNYLYKEVIILLSDGLNTQDRWYGNGSATSTQVDGRMYATGGAGTCKNITDAGITIYTIQVNTGGDPQSTLLSNCASPGKFVMLTTASQIITTFQQIGTQLSQLRIAR